jgi:hypothetical protein
MLLSKSLKLILSTFLVFGCLSARADLRQPDAYEALKASGPLAPGHGPRAVNGLAQLSAEEGHHKESLPFQLNGAMAKIKKSKYSPKAF